MLSAQPTMGVISTLTVIFLFLLTTTNAQGVYYGNRCYILDDPLEDREAIADVVFSGRILAVHRNPYNSTYYCSVHIYRVMKGAGIINNLLELPADTYLHYNKTVEVSGFGNERICNSEVVVNDTRKFLLSYHRTTNLTLNSSLARVGVRSIRKSLAGE